MVYKWNPNHHGKDTVSANPVVSSFLARAFVPFVQLILEFQFTATTIMSMATKSSDSEDWTLGANLQTEGHIPKPSKGQKDPEETEALGVLSPTCHLGLQPGSNCLAALTLDTV